MNVNIFDLGRDHREMKGELVRIFEEVLSGGQFILGRGVKALEEAFASYIGVRHGVGVGNGTDAIRVGGLALGLTTGDKIITTPNTYVATAMALSVQGIDPVFCDIEEETLNMDPALLDDILKKHKDIKVCIPVHLYGHSARMDEIMQICTAHGVRVLEDAAQAHGALYKNRKVGSLGDAAIFSFYPTKNLGGFGDGGILVTDSDEVYERALRLRNFGQDDRAKHVHITEGFNSRLDELQAAMIHYKLPFLDVWNEKRRALASLYTRTLAGIPVSLPLEEPWARHVYHIYAIRSEKRKDLMTYLSSKGITTIINYPTPIHLQQVYARLGYKEGSFPVAEKAAREIITLPMYPSLTEDEVQYVSQTIRDFYGAGAA
ncbi:MAG: DegT/DnrJ/EryC1/StrS family aminotransferase [Syntrophobacterales bacterium]|nr:DegT/DnrJ/EryC1/StrS family aminotransferase [Syntrophobacterales bacterium]